VHPAALAAVAAWRRGVSLSGRVGESRPVRAGGVLLLAVVLAVLTERSLHGQWRLDLMVYAAGIWLIMAHGAAWTQPGKPAGSD